MLNGFQEEVHRFVIGPGPSTKFVATALPLLEKVWVALEKTHLIFHLLPGRDEETAILGLFHGGTTVRKNDASVCQSFVDALGDVLIHDIFLTLKSKCKRGGEIGFSPRVVRPVFAVLESSEIDAMKFGIVGYEFWAVGASHIAVIAKDNARIRADPVGCLIGPHQ